MRTVRYEVYARSAIPGEEEEGTVADLLQILPYVLALKVIPPLSVVNDLLRRGADDAGMSGGCRWVPFEIDQAEWQEVAAALAERDDRLRYVAPSPWVETFEDWHVWLFEHLYGVPAEEHRRLSLREEELRRRYLEARAAGDEERAMELHVEGLAVGNQLAELIMRYVRPGRR